MGETQTGRAGGKEPGRHSGEGCSRERSKPGAFKEQQSVAGESEREKLGRAEGGDRQGPRGPGTSF